MPKRTGESIRREHQNEDSREYATAHEKLGLDLSDPVGTKHADTYMKNVGKRGLQRQQERMGETGRMESFIADLTSGMGGRAKRDLGGPRTPPHK